MSKIFTDETGATWEECPIDSRPEHMVIRPVKAEPKWLIHETDKNYIKIELFGDAIDQAQLIKACIQSLMEYLTCSWKDDYEGKKWQDFDDAVDKARQSLRENN